MRCKNCPNEFKSTIKTRNRKYCDICKYKIWKIQKRDWKRKKVGTFGVDHKCLNCEISLEGFKTDRKYCDSCNRERKRIWDRNNYLKERLITN